MMNASEYQITIKSANQKVDDYVTSCESDWTVQRLKQHISETHINKPRIEEQRLIYAGNILKDLQTLKQIFFRDSLCTELTNSSKTDFTIHLVCSQNSTPLSATSKINQSLASDNQAARVVDSNQTSNAQGATEPPSPAGDPQIFPIHRHRTTAAMTRPHEIAENFFQTDHMRQQMASFQQLANLVAAQLVQNAALSGETVNSPGPDFDMLNLAPPVIVRDPDIGRIDAGAGILGQVPLEQPVIQQPAAMPANQMGNQEAQEAQHDVIDWVYYSIRAMVLMTALYINASIFRLSFLAGLLALAYYLSRRSARRTAQQLNQQNGPRPRGEAANNVEPQMQPVLQHPEGPIPDLQDQPVAQGGLIRRRPRDGGTVDERTPSDNDNVGEDLAQNERRVQQRGVSFLKLCYLVITDFLASLVPE